MNNVDDLVHAYNKKIIVRNLDGSYTRDRKNFDSPWLLQSECQIQNRKMGKIEVRGGYVEYEWKFGVPVRKNGEIVRNEDFTVVFDSIIDEEISPCDFFYIDSMELKLIQGADYVLSLRAKDIHGLLFNDYLPIDITPNQTTGEFKS